MTISTELHRLQQAHIPHTGQHILAHYDAEHLIVYQAYKAGIARYAVQHQQLGGPEFSFNRMSWIKPNFLWMMYRCGWASKENQERVLALRLTKTGFECILREAVHSSFKQNVYPSQETWKTALQNQAVRLQWDPDHDPTGRALARRAIQLGMNGEMLRKFCTQFTVAVEDITDFVHEQKKLLDQGKADELRVPVERVFRPSASAGFEHLQLD